MKLSEDSEIRQRKYFRRYPFVIFFALLNCGTNDSSLTVEDKEHTRFVNSLSLFCATVCLSYCLILYRWLGPLHALLSLLTTVSFCFVLYLNKRGRRFQGKQLFIATANVSHFIGSDLFTPASELYLYFLIIGLSPFIIFRARRMKYRLFWSSISLILMLLSAYVPHLIFPADFVPEAAQRMAFWSRIGVFFTSIISILVLMRSIDRLMQDLSHHKARLNQAQNLARIGTFEINLKQSKVRRSESLFQIYGLEPMQGDAQALNFDHIIEEDRLALLRDFENVSEVKGPVERTYRVLKKDGTIVEIRSFMDIERDAKGLPTYIIGASQDVTKDKERDRIIREQEAKIISSSKLSALGEMAGGIAHEINNPLAIIQAKCEQIKRMAEQKKLDEKKLDDGISLTLATIERIAKIVRGLRSFSRSSEKDAMEPKELSKILSETISLCQEKLKFQGIELRLAVDDGLVLCCRDAQIAQIFMNLIINSQHAMEERGEKWIEIRAEKKESRIQVLFIDSGFGISDEIKEKIMQPFFTTKAPGKGTGLGLSISRSIAEDHGGSLAYDPSAAHTTFVLDLPAYLRGPVPRGT